MKEVVNVETQYMNYEPLIQYSEVYGIELEEAQIIEKLKTLKGVKMMAILSKLNSLFLAMLRGEKVARKVYNEIKRCHKSKISINGGDCNPYMKYNFIYGTQTIYVLMKKVIAYSEFDDENITSIEIEELHMTLDLLMSVNDLLPQNEVHGHETEYIYLSTYHNTHNNIMADFSRAYYIFNTKLRENNNTEKFIIDYEQKNGYSLEYFFYVIFLSLTITLVDNSIAEFLSCKLVIDRNFDAKGLGSVYPKVIDNISQTIGKMKTNTIKNLENLWDFDLFYRFPMLKTQDYFICISSTFLTYNMWEGLYWNIRYMYTRADGNGEKYLSEFGRPFEEYVQEIAMNSCEKSKGMAEYQEEFTYYIGKQEHRSSEAYIKIEDSLFIIEAKAKSPHSDTLKGVNLNKILEEVEELLVKPVHQVDDRLFEVRGLFEKKKIPQKLERILEEVKQVFVIVVTMEKVQPVGSLLRYADNLLVKSDKYKIKNCDIISYFNICIRDYEAICNLIEESPLVLGRLLKAWFDESRVDDKTIIPLANYLDSMQYPYKVPSELEERFRNIIKDISNVIFGKS